MMWNLQSFPNNSFEWKNVTLYGVKHILPPRRTRPSRGENGRSWTDMDKDTSMKRVNRAVSSRESVVIGGRIFTGVSHYTCDFPPKQQLPLIPEIISGSGPFLTGLLSCYQPSLTNHSRNNILAETWTVLVVSGRKLEQNCFHFAKDVDYTLWTQMFGERWVAELNWLNNQKTPALSRLV